jgi:UDPglucose--hexose-1-phosphate uridylyltransferase
MNERHGAELRLDPLTRRWVAVTAGRQHRPNLPAKDCPFCIGGLEAPLPYVVKSFENRWPPLTPGAPLRLADEFGTRAPACGAAEIVLYSPDHHASLATLGLEGIRRVVDLWVDRSQVLSARPEIEHVLVFENRGREAGATISHPHGQIYAFPFVPPAPALEAEVAAVYGCQLCAEVARVRDDPTCAIAMRSTVAGFAHPAASWPFEVLIAPLEHTKGLGGLDDHGRDELADVLGDLLARFDVLFGRPLPYMFWIHAGVHLHVHLMTPYRSADSLRYVAAGEIGSGLMFNPVAPETATDLLKAATKGVSVPDGTHGPSVGTVPFGTKETGTTGGVVTSP